MLLDSPIKGEAPTTEKVSRTFIPTRKKSRRKQPLDWIDDLEKHVFGERSLWVSVIVQALMDALSRSCDGELYAHKDEAIHWLTHDSVEFHFVCLNAGLDPDYVRVRAKKALLHPSPWRNEAGMGMRYEEGRAYRARLKRALREHAVSPHILPFSTPNA